MALVGEHLYVADTDALLRFPYREGDTRSMQSLRRFADLPAGAINHHWTKNVIASADGSKLYVTVGSNSNAGDNGMDERDGPRRDPRDRFRNRTVAPLRLAACVIRTVLPGSPRAARCGPPCNERDSSAATSFRTT